MSVHISYGRENSRMVLTVYERLWIRHQHPHENELLEIIQNGTLQQKIALAKEIGRDITRFKNDIKNIQKSDEDEFLEICHDQIADDKTLYKIVMASIKADLKKTCTN